LVRGNKPQLSSLLARITMNQLRTVNVRPGC
jgi:hypothetical protein